MAAGVLDLISKLGGNIPSEPSKQWLCTNKHGVTHVISDENYQRMQLESTFSDAAENKLKTYTFQDAAGIEEPKGKAGKKDSE
jgi:hypothetical protein